MDAKSEMGFTLEHVKISDNWARNVRSIHNRTFLLPRCLCHKLSRFHSFIFTFARSLKVAFQSLFTALTASTHF
jgi:hypothetical protein